MEGGVREQGQDCSIFIQSGGGRDYMLLSYGQGQVFKLRAQGQVVGRGGA